VCTVFSTYNVQYMLVRQNSTYSSTVCAKRSQCPSFFEVGSIQALKDANDKVMQYTEVSLTKNLSGKTNLAWKSLGK